MTWWTRAACRGKDADQWFPEKGGGTRAAKRICGTCPVQAECLADALERDERFGVWGGLSERERRRLKRVAS
jgi:WhiB family redox-sensing transcriptional regulator